MLVEWDAVDGCRAGSMPFSLHARQTTGAIQSPRRLPLFLDVHRDGSCVRERDTEELRQRNALRALYKKQREPGYLSPRKKCDFDGASCMSFGDGHLPPLSAAVSNVVDGITIRKISRSRVSDNASSLSRDNFVLLSPRFNHHTLQR